MSECVAGCGVIAAKRSRNSNGSNTSPRVPSRHALAEPLYRRTLGILEKSVGRQHQRAGIALNKLAEVYRAQGRWEDAGRFYPQAIAIVEKDSDPDHPTVAGLLENYAVVPRRARRDAEALEIDLRARDIRAGHAIQNPRRQQVAHVPTGCSRGPRCEAAPDAAGRREGSRCEAAPRCAS
jgi:tetratricopeptide (TPR) repeat protein